MDNPYDRRWRGRNTDGIERIEDLDALAFSAHTRGVQNASDRLARQHRDEIQTAQREAWAEGHGTGMVEGQQAMLRSIDDQFGEKAGQLVERGQELRSLDRRKVTKLDLEQALDVTVSLLTDLIAAHHNAFVRQLPF